MAAPELRPLGVGEILDAALKVYRRNALTLWKIIALVVVPVNVVGALVMMSVLPDDFFEPGFVTDPTSATISTSDLWAVAAAGIVVAIISIVTIVAATAACLKVVSDSYLGERSDAGSSLAFAARRLHSLIWVGFLTVFFSLLVGLITIPGVLAAGPLGLVLAIPALWLWISWSFAPPAFLVEGTKGLSALRRSFRLVRGRWWPVFGTLLLGYIITWIVGAGVEAVANAFLDDPETLTGGVVVDTVIRSLSGIVTTPFSAAVLGILYFDLRVRKEGFDVELLAQRIGETSGPGGTLPPGSQPTP